MNPPVPSPEVCTSCKEKASTSQPMANACARDTWQHKVLGAKASSRVYGQHSASQLCDGLCPTRKGTSWSPRESGKEGAVDSRNSPRKQDPDVQPQAG